MQRSTPACKIRPLTAVCLAFEQAVVFGFLGVPFRAQPPTTPSAAANGKSY